MNEPIVSVVIPVFNRRRHVEEAVRSVEAQTFTSWELIVVDDGSTDDTVDALREVGTRHRVLRRPNGGCAAARNTGVAAARGRYVAFLDSDDLWPARKLEIQVPLLDADATLDHVFGQQEYFSDEPTYVHLAGRRSPGALAGTLLTRRESFARVGPMPEVPMGEFVQWMTLCRAAGLRERMLDDVLLLRRVHAGNCVHDAEGMAASRMDAVREKLRRARAAGG